MTGRGTSTIYRWINDESEPHFTESPPGGAIVAAFLERAFQARRRALQVSGRLPQRAEVIAQGHVS